MNKKIGESVQICGVSVSSSQADILLTEIEQKLASRRNDNMVFVTTPNPEQVVQASENDTFRHVLNQSEVSLPDGVGLLWAAKLLHGVQIERMPGVEVAESLLEFCGKHSLKAMIVGGRLNRDQISNLKSQITNKFKIQNSHPKDDEPLAQNFKISEGAKNIAKETSEENEKILDQVREFKPDLLLVAYGAPWQEMWIYNNREELEGAGVRVAMVVGGAVDVWAGKVKRAPETVRKAGFEWFWRLSTQPWRWRRQLRLLKFVGMVLWEKYRR